jgi:hypothetical protein
MATTLTIGGQPREIRFSGIDLDLAEREIVKRGGRAITAVLGNHGGLFTKHELEWLLWGAWRHKVSTDRLHTLLAQFYADGGTVFDLQAVVTEALLDSGLYGKRQERVDDGDAADEGAAGARRTNLSIVDPPAAGTSG